MPPMRSDQFNENAVTGHVLVDLGIWKSELLKLGLTAAESNRIAQTLRSSVLSGFPEERQTSQEVHC